VTLENILDIFILEKSHLSVIFVNSKPTPKLYSIITQRLIQEKRIISVQWRVVSMLVLERMT